MNIDLDLDIEPVAFRPIMNNHNQPASPASPAAPAAPDAPATAPAKSAGLKSARLLNLLGRIAALVVVYLFFVALTPGARGFTSDANTQLMLQDIAVVAMAAIGMTLVLIAGGIDLSAGSVIALAMITTAYILDLGPADNKFVLRYPVFLPILALFGATAVASLVGLFNGLLVTYLRIVPFIITLGTMQMARGLAKLVAGEQNIYPPAEVQDLWISRLLEPAPTVFTWPFLPVGVWLVIGMAILTALFLRYTRLGRHIFAIGSNEKTAVLCGVPVARTKVLVYVIGGFFAGLAGVVFFARLGSIGQPTEAIGYELFVIAAAVIGGTSLLGGRGTILGTMIGALIITILRNGGVKMGWPQYTQEIVMGAVIIVAVAIDNLRNSPGGVVRNLRRLFGGRR
ncbi:MAG: ABC transporter permease [Opitutaceae bacterium]|nr:ABC transporter permease [Opitutaceae bacterium]